MNCGMEGILLSHILEQLEENVILEEMKRTWEILIQDLMKVYSLDIL